MEVVSTWPGYTIMPGCVDGRKLGAKRGGACAAEKRSGRVAMPPQEVQANEVRGQ